jgi:GNAT superfamily N-acetyltransferase
MFRTPEHELREFCNSHGCIFLERFSVSGKKHARIRYVCACGRTAEAILCNFKKYPNCWECSKAKKSGDKCHLWNPDREAVRLRKKYAKICSNALGRCLKAFGTDKSATTRSLLGYTPADLLAHLRSFPGFDPDAEFHIDHIFPVRAFVDYEIFDLKTINSLRNLRPLPGPENLSKGAKYDAREFERWLGEMGVAAGRPWREGFEECGAPGLGIVLFDDLRHRAKGVRELIAARSPSNPCYVVYPHEWTTRSQQILAHVRSYSDPALKSVYARKCQIRPVALPEVWEFCDKYHIQGSNRLGLVAWGLYLDDDLLGVLSLGRHNRQASKEEVVLDRLCFRADVRVVGGASRLFSAAKSWATEHGYLRISSFSDNRYTTGGVYERLGFGLEKELPPDYLYVKRTNPVAFRSKQSEQKHLTACPEDMTEQEWARVRGYVRVYDAGKKRWVYTLPVKPVPVPTSRQTTYYHRHIATDKVEVFCDYCQETHTPLRLTHDKNLARNGRYICEREGGHIAGSKPKKKKENPYAADGKKECTRCKCVKTYAEFSPDSSRRDGLCSRCKECRAAAGKASYQAAKGDG